MPSVKVVVYPLEFYRFSIHARSITGLCNIFVILENHKMSIQFTVLLRSRFEKPR